MASRPVGREKAKRRLKEVRYEWKKRVKEAKSAWVQEQCEQINNECVGAFDCGKKVWEAIAKLKGGLQKTRTATAVPLKQKSGQVCVGAAQNAERFREHFHELYGRGERFDWGALDSIRQHEEWVEAGRTPSDKEIRAAVGRLNLSSPGVSGIGAAAVKATVMSDRGFALVKEMVMDFWEGEVAPKSWEDGLLKILPKSGDLSQPGNYRGVMLLEVLYKVIANLIKDRLTPIQESLEQESQCGFRPGRGCSDASFSLRMAIKKRREHGLETWVLLLDLVKAFDRVPRSLLWAVLRKFGVPGKLVRLLEALHSTVNVGFEVEEVRVVLDSIIGVKQGDLLGPQLFIFHICAIMQAWKVDYGPQYEQCRFRTKQDSVVCSRRWEEGTNCSGRGGMLVGVVEADEQRLRGACEYIRARVRRVEGKTVAQALRVRVLGARGGSKQYQRADLRYDLQHGFVRLDGEFGGGLRQGHGGVMEFGMMDSEYADDTGLVFGDRETAARMAPLVNKHFARWGMQVHEKKPTDTKVKTLVLFCAAPPSVYTNPHTFDDADLSDIVLPTGNVIPVVDRAKYLGSMISRDGTDKVDVEARIAAATRAFGSLSKLVFQSAAVSPSAKREAYVALVMSILLYGSEGWCLTAALWRKLRSFHHRCARRMCRVSMWHTREFRISSASLLKVLGLRNVETYVCRRQLQWAGHVARMGMERLPRRFLSAWCGRPRPVGRPEMTYGATIEAALSFAGVRVEEWMTLAQDRVGWKQTINGIWDVEDEIEVHAVLERRAGVVSV